MKSKIGIVIQREYFSRVRKKSFLIMTFLMPVIFAALIFVPLWMSGIKDDQQKTVAIIDQTGKYAPLFENMDNFHFIPVDKKVEEYQHDRQEGIYATLVISGDLLKNPSAITLYSEKQVTMDLTKSITQTLNTYLQDEKLASYNIPRLKEIMEESKVSIQLQTIKWEKDGTEKESSAEMASIIGILFTVIIYMFIFVYGGMVMQGVMEEKTNRIIEVMVSSVKPFDLMMGKIIGVGLVGLTQFFLWSGLVGFFLFIGRLFLGGGIDPAQAAQMAELASHGQNINMEGISKVVNIFSSINIMEIVSYFLIYFIGGYMLYASLFAAIGASVSNQEDTQQFMLPITALILFAFYAAIYSMENPDGPLAFWTSIIPITSPIVMMVRLPFDVPLWQKILSVVLLYITFILVTRFSAKIYRVGILMYGKKPSVKELIKWIKYKA